MDEAENRARIARFFAPLPTGGFVLAVVGLIVFIIGAAIYAPVVFLPGVLIVVGGAALLLRSLSGRPTEAEFDEWLSEDLEELFERARGALKISPEDVIAEPILIGPGHLFMGWPAASRINAEHLPPNAWRAGTDGVLRVGAFSYQVFFPTEKSLASFWCVYDFCEGKSYNERTEEFFYRDVVSVGTRAQEFDIERSERAGLLGLRKEAKRYTFGDFESFRLTVAGGDFIEVLVKCAEPQRMLLKREASLPSGPYEEAVAAVRKLLRERK
jgi:hypothetical protein